MYPTKLFLLICLLCGLGLLACQSPELATEPTPIAQNTAVTATPIPKEVAPTATNTSTSTVEPTDTPTNTPTVQPTMTSTPKPSNTPIPSPTFTSTPTEPLPIGLEYLISGDLYQVNENGEAVLVPNGRTNTSADGAVTLVVTPDAPFYQEESFGEAFWQNNEINTYAPLSIPNFGDGAISDWWLAEPDWVLLHLALGGSWSESGWPQSGIVRTDGTGYRFLGGFAAVNPVGEWIAYRKDFWTRLEPSEQTGMWLTNIQTGADFKIDFATYGLPDVVNDCVGRPTWSPNGRFLTFFIFSNCGLPHYGTIFIDTWENSAELLPIRYGGPEGPPTAPFWSPTGEFLIIQGAYEMRSANWILTSDQTIYHELEMGLYGRWINDSQLVYLDYNSYRWLLFDVETLGTTAVTLPEGAYIKEFP